MATCDGWTSESADSAGVVSQSLSPLNSQFSRLKAQGSRLNAQCVRLSTPVSRSWPRWPFRRPLALRGAGTDVVAASKATAPSPSSSLSLAVFRLALSPPLQQVVARSSVPGALPCWLQSLAPLLLEILPSRVLDRASPNSRSISRCLLSRLRTRW
eukprot:scaffold485_cov272-Pinguiococcus_pyrenoidosus.AAC.5